MAVVELVSDLSGGCSSIDSVLQIMGAATHSHCIRTGITRVQSALLQVEDSQPSSDVVAATDDEKEQEEQFIQEERAVNRITVSSL
jgi:hypothetical protein